MFDDLSGDDVKETVNVAAGILGQIGFIGSIALAISFLGVCILSSLAATGKMSLEIFTMLSLPLIGVPIILAYSQWKKTEERYPTKKKTSEKKDTKMEGIEWIKWFFVIILFIGIICWMWAAVMIVKTDCIIGRPELLENPSYMGTIKTLGITGLIMVSLFIIAGLIISHKEEEAKKTVASREEG